MSYTIGTNFPDADRMALLDAILNVTNEDFRIPEEIGLPMGRSLADLQGKCGEYDAIIHRDRTLMQEMLFDGDPSGGTPQATDWTKFHANFNFKDATAFTEANLNIPLYNGDVETATGLPGAVALLVDQISSADAVVISTPEYNKGISGVLKNALDWVSRAYGNPWLDKPVAIISATAGRGGGERAQTMAQKV